MNCKTLKKSVCAAALCVLASTAAFAKPREKKMKEHYTFELSDGVVRTKVRFKNHFGIEIAGDLYTPKGLKGEGGGHRRFRSVRGSEGAGFRAVRCRACLTRICRAGVRPVVHGRKRRRAEVHEFARHQHRGLSGGG